jgi:hypothetical protein
VGNKEFCKGFGLGFVSGAVALLIAAAPSANAAEVEKGEMVGVQMVCTTREAVEEQVRAVRMNEGRYAEAQAILERQVEEGVCAALPMPMGRFVNEVGSVVGPFIDADGDKVTLTTIEVGGFWTVHFTLHERGGKS